MAGTEHDPTGPALESTLVVPEGKTLAGKYQMGRLLGEGGMGSVYEAEHTGLHKRVAIKLLSEHYAEDDVFVKRFRREARAMAAVTHDNIVQVTDTGEDEEGVPFIVMELLDGESLAAVIRRERTIPPATSADIAGQVLAGLAAAHKKGIIHRDLKPANVFLAQAEDGSQRAKVLDFGISKFAADLTNLNVTAEGAVIGTPAYMSPEQVKGRSDVDRRADLYAVGVMLYRMLTGRLPYAGKKPKDIYDKILRGKPTPIQEHRPDVSDDLAAVVMKAMSVRKSERYATAEEFFEDLRMACPDMEATGPMPLITRSGSVPSQYPPESYSETGPTRNARAQPSPSAATTNELGPSRKRNGVILGALAVVLLGFGVALIVNGTGGGDVGPDDPTGTTTGELDPDPDPDTDPEDPPVVYSGSALRYGVVAYADDERIHRTHDPLCTYLTEHLDRPVELVILEEYEVSRAFEEQTVSFAALSAKRYIEQNGEHPELRLVAFAAGPGGSSYIGQIFVRPDSGIETLAELGGKVMCFPARDSSSGYLYPRALFRQEGIDPDTAFSAQSFHGGNHGATLRALAAGDCDGAAAYQGAVSEAGFQPQEFHVIKSTPRIPSDAYVIAPGLDEEDAQAITDTLLSLRPGSPEAEAAFGDGQLRGFTPAQDSDYDEAREIIGLVAHGEN